MDLKKWYKRIIGKIGLVLFFQRKELSIILNEKDYEEGKTKRLLFSMLDKQTGKDCMIEIKICE